jgi:hypothetical protein|tara:strand:+ start:183 stop:530 length:348 start_codon:yes stop_codon:yes gene_type:complete
MENKEMWTIDELTSLTTTVQSAEIEYQGKVLPVQWCELTESEEPKMSMAPEDVDETQHYAEIASERMLAMINKANTLNPEGKTLDESSWKLLPTTLRWSISNTVMQTKDSNQSDF